MDGSIKGLDLRSIHSLAHVVLAFQIPSCCSSSVLQSKREPWNSSRLRSTVASRHHVDLGCCSCLGLAHQRAPPSPSVHINVCTTFEHSRVHTSTEKLRPQRCLYAAAERHVAMSASHLTMHAANIKLAARTFDQQVHDDAAALPDVSRA
ncbi:hypothetical protein K437DRAFT_157153 [Tilletiaria anomala UBC 951]|uniref:Uncharacterized protein n=1 Tax=Tilletiaria anomala (strain ATCC 24038 / CBS 436.72 / UBC 951) TaxID=1037660 RepID=A0A066VMC9_TILAU|nr:uncharacterized protein K437DRAFT_157153 [Tilletiaria anomala UBC 951]KDN42877.1 hypothetical protein K437DRAFT_157153 [Tilletiaria anomala UBC 951]